MGSKSSKLSVQSFDEAFGKLSLDEQERLELCFKRHSLGDYISFETFIREVLCEEAPNVFSKILFDAIGGTSKGITYKKLIIALVTLAKGDIEEKCRFLFNMFSADGEYVTYSDIFHCLKDVENADALQPFYISLNEAKEDRIDFENFLKWAVASQKSFAIIGWFLDSPIKLNCDNYCPTFYQTLCGVTHLDENDIECIEKQYSRLVDYKVGKLRLDQFRVCLNRCIPDELAYGLFQAFDENGDGEIDFKEFVCGISACCRGPKVERLKFIFKMFDEEKSSYLTRKNVFKMISTIVRNRDDCSSSGESESKYDTDISAIVDEVFVTSCSKANNNILSLNDYCVWAIQSEPFFDSLLFLLYQNSVCSLNTTHCQSSFPSTGMGCTPPRTNSSINNDEYSSSQGTCHCSADRNSIQSTLFNNGCSIDCEVSNTSNNDYSSESGWESEHCTNSKKSGFYKKGSSAAIYDVARASSTNSRYETLPNTSTPNTMSRMTLTPGNHSTFRSWSPCPKATPQSEIIIEFKPPCKPGPIDNSSLVSAESISSKLVSLTLEGGILMPGISVEDGQDFYALPDTLWKAMVRWYRGGSPVLPRTLIFNSITGQYELELYPVVVTFLKHQQINASSYSTSRYNHGSHISHFSGGAFFGPGVYSNYPPQVRLPTIVRVPMYSAAFSRNNKLVEIFKFLCQQLNLNAEATRLWLLSQEDVNVAKATLLEDDTSTLSELQISTGAKILIEVRNADLTWPEEIINLSRNRHVPNRESCERGLTGLNNLGNTCFLNSALQCISNTQPLTQYFTRNVHLYELNRGNKFGMKGQIALQYATLVRDLWSGSTRVTAPLKLRYTVCKYAPTFNDFNQHDCQELISFLLDGLHEDLNRVQVKSYVELKDSNGRPDEVVAAEAWENHIRRNQSVIVDLFHGLLKSTVTCRVCSTPSVTFDPFTFLSLPLPLDNLVFVQVVVVKLDGSVPAKYGLRILNDAAIADLRKSLSSLCGLEPHNFLFLHLLNYSIIQEVLKDDIRMKNYANTVLYAFETPVVKQMEERLVEECTQTSHPENTESFKIEKPNSSMQRSFSSVANGTDMNTQARTLNTHKRSLSYVQWDRNVSSRSETAPPSIGGKTDCKFQGFTIGIQRRLERKDFYFVGHHQYKPITFGLPLVLPADVNETTWSGKYLYENVQAQLARLIAPGNKCSRFNHALDGDEHLYCEYPFVLKIVAKNLNSRGFCRCARCPWYRFCFGCPIECDENFLIDLSDCFIAIDWDITAWHLRYNPSLETHFEEHPSVKEAHALHIEPITLDSCLKVFTQPEELKDGDNYFCSRCGAHCPASKKLDIWRLPPILIIHFKRFQYVNEKWVKSCKLVNFPRSDFNPSNYLAVNNCDKKILSSRSAKETPEQNGLSENSEFNGDGREAGVNEVAVDVPDAFEKCLPCGQHNHRLLDDTVNNDDLKYDLYAVACHAGMLGAGHYVAYARNINEKWYLYNDSSCKQIDPNDIDSSLAYILFYERRGLDYGKYIPDLTGKTPHNVDAADREIDSEFKRACCIQ